jgi:hypothetical protein
MIAQMDGHQKHLMLKNVHFPCPSLDTGKSNLAQFLVEKCVKSVDLKIKLLNIIQIKLLLADSDHWNFVQQLNSGRN